MTDTAKRPMFSRTSIGRDRWYWVVVEEWGEEPIAKGVADSSEGALAKAERQYGPVHHKPGTLARGFWKKHQSLVTD